MLNTCIRLSCVVNLCCRVKLKFVVISAAIISRIYLSLSVGKDENHGDRAY